jgi:predicted dinucleotide-binding enzyme
MTKIGILGSGIVARSLGTGFIKHGYDTMLGTREPSKLKEWQSSTSGKVGSFDEAALHGEILVLAVKGTVAEEFIKSVATHLTGKTIIDTTNPIAEVPPQNGVLSFFTKPDESLMERLQRVVPSAHFVKSFNSVGNNFMVDPAFPDRKPTMFICGNDDKAKAQVTNILDQFGWEISDMGKAEGARAIEPLCILWCIPGMLRNEWSHAFKLIKM